MTNLSETAVQWAADRGISRSTLERAGVGSGMSGMPEAGKCEVIAFPYRRDGKIINTKYRALKAKSFKQQEGGELRFWNLDGALKEKSERVYITEGEMDAGPARIAVAGHTVAKDGVHTFAEFRLTQSTHTGVG